MLWFISWLLCGRWPGVTVVWLTLFHISHRRCATGNGRLRCATSCVGHYFCAFGIFVWPPSFLRGKQHLIRWSQRPSDLLNGASRSGPVINSHSASVEPADHNDHLPCFPQAQLVPVCVCLLAWSLSHRSWLTGCVRVRMWR